MIIIANKNKENIIHFPKNLYKYDSNLFNVILYNRATNVKYEFKNLADMHYYAKDFYSFSIGFTNVPEDEYEYKIINENKIVLATGIIKLYSDVAQIYYHKNDEYIVYNKI